MTALRQDVAQRECWGGDEAGANVDTPGDTGWRRDPAQRLALARTIEAEIIPRLLLAHRVRPRRDAALAEGAWAPARVDIEAFATLLLASEDAAALAYVEAIRARGVALEAIYLELFAPAARHLGDLWLEDARDFAEVTLGLCRLHQFLHRFSAAFHDGREHAEHGRRALILPVPGEQHSFGAVMVAEFFRRAGWDVQSDAVPTIEAAAASAREAWFDVFGLSVSCEAHLDRVGATIRAVRRASRNPRIVVLVGGRVFLEQPHLAELVGADATASDALQAAVRAQALVGTVAGHG